MARIFGFTLLRNGVKYDYSFRECLESLSKVTEKVYLALGKSEDSTEEAVSDLDFLKIKQTVWDDSLRKGGLILSQQTNEALDFLREDHKKTPGSWGVYLQCDEVFHEEDYELIKEDIRKAEEEGCDTMTFRYFHFWMNHHSVAINKKWYPQEIRAIKLDSDIESWGDAQSFRNHSKTYHSEARIFHYGHVREEESYKNKKKDILTLYHSDEKLPKYKRRERRFDRQTECLDFWGNHPLLMKDRIERLGDIWNVPERESAYIVLNGQQIHQDFIKKINAKNVQVCHSLSEVPRKERKFAAILNPSLIEKMLYRSHVPSQMRSKIAHPWNNETILLFKLSEKGIGLKV